VINGFWYYNAIATPVTTSTATTSTTSTAIPTLPAVDSFDVRIKTFNQYLAEIFTNVLVRNTTHSISRYISGLSNDRLVDELLVDDGLYSGYRPPNYIVVGTSRESLLPGGGATDEFTDSEIAALTEWVRTGGTLFICGEYRSSPTDAFYNYKVDKIIEELGGVGWSRTTGIDPDWYFSWQRMAGSLPQSSYVQTTQEAIDLGIVLDMNDSPIYTGRRMYTSGARRIHNPASKGVPLLPAPKDGSLFTYISGKSDPGDPYESIIHMWDGKLVHLDPGVTGKIIWLGDTQQTIDNDRALEESIITPLITYIEKQRIQ